MCQNEHNLREAFENVAASLIGDFHVWVLERHNKAFLEKKRLERVRRDIYPLYICQQHDEALTDQWEQVCSHLGLVEEEYHLLDSYYLCAVDRLNEITLDASNPMARQLWHLFVTATHSQDV
jgi:hypothetical protein